MGGFSKRDPPKFKLLEILSRTHEIFKLSKYKAKIKFDKIWGYQIGVLPKYGHQKSNFLTNHARHYETFKIGKYEQKIKFDNILGYQNEGNPLKQGCQNSNCNHLC